MPHTNPFFYFNRAATGQQMPLRKINKYIEKGVCRLAFPLSLMGLSSFYLRALATSLLPSFFLLVSAAVVTQGMIAKERDSAKMAKNIDGVLLYYSLTTKKMVQTFVACEPLLYGF